MHGPGKKFLAGTGLAEQQAWCVRPSDQRYLLRCRTQLRGLANHSWQQFSLVRFQKCQRLSVHLPSPKFVRGGARMVITWLLLTANHNSACVRNKVVSPACIFCEGKDWSSQTARGGGATPPVAADRTDSARRHVETGACFRHAADAEWVQLGIPAENGNVAGQRLGSDHAIKPVAMFAGETTGPEGALNADGQERVATIIGDLQTPPPGSQLQEACQGGSWS